MGYRLIEAPADVSGDLLERAIAHVAADSSEADMLRNQLKASIATLDGANGALGRTIMAQTWAWDVDAFPADGRPLHLPLPPCQGGADWLVDSVSYFDVEGVSRTLTAGVDYVAPAGRGFLIPVIGGSWPDAAAWPGAVTVTVTSGSDDVAALPENLVAAVLLMVGDLFKNRETTVEGTISAKVPMSTTVTNLLAGLVYTRPDV